MSTTGRQDLFLQQRLNDLRAVMGTDTGRRFVWSVLVDAGVFADTFAAGAPDVSAYRQGRRAQGLELRDRLMRDVPREWVVMVQDCTAMEAAEAVPEPVQSLDP